MSEADKMATKIAERRERALREMNDLATNPELAKGTVGTVVFALMQAGKEVSTASIVAALEAIVSGAEEASGLSDVLAKGALKVISDLHA